MVSDFDLKLSATIKEEIEKHGDSQKDIADDLGIKYTTFNSYVNGGAKVPAFVVAKIAERYDLTTDQLIFADGATSTKQNKLNNSNTQLMLESLAIFLLISEFDFLHFYPGTEKDPRQLSGVSGPLENVYSFYKPPEQVQDEHQLAIISLALQDYSGGNNYDNWFTVIETLVNISHTEGTTNAEKYAFMQKAISGIIKKKQFSERFDGLSLSESDY